MKFSKLLLLAIFALCLIVSEAHSIRRPRPHHHHEEEEEGSGSEVRPHFPHHHHHHHGEEESGSEEHPHPHFPHHLRFRHEEEKEGSDSEEHPHPHFPPHFRPHHHHHHEEEEESGSEEHPHFPPHFRPHHHHHHKEGSDSDSEEHPHFPPHFRPHHHHHEEESGSDSEEHPHPHFPPHFRPHHHHHHEEESGSDSEEHPHFPPHFRPHHHHHHHEEEENESEEHPQLRQYKALKLKERKERLLKVRDMKMARPAEERAPAEQLRKALGKRRPMEKLLRRAKKVSGRSDVEEVQYTTYSDAACEEANEIIIKSVGCKMRVFGSFEKIVFDEQNENNMTVYSYSTPGCSTTPVNGRSFLKGVCTLDPSTNEYVKWEW